MKVKNTCCLDGMGQLALGSYGDALLLTENCIQRLFNFYSIEMTLCARYISDI